MTKEDLKQIQELLIENNKVLKEDIISQMGEIVNSAFSEFEGKVNHQFTEIKNELELKPNSDRIFTWADNILLPVRVDTMKLKYLLRKEMKDLPDNLTIKSALIEEGLE